MLDRLRAFIGGRPAVAQAARREVPLAEYDRTLKASLTALPPRTQGAFAAACAERDSGHANLPVGGHGLPR